MTEAEFDKLLRQALLEAVWQENKAYVEQAEEKDIEFSERYLKRREKMLRDPFAYAKKMSRTIWQRMARSAAVLFVTLSLLFAMAMAVPAVRAAVINIVERWYENRVEWQFSGEEEYTKIPENIEIGYLPEGYVEKERHVTPNNMIVVFGGEKEEEIIELECYVAENGLLTGSDIEHSLQTTVIDNAIEYHLIHAVDKGWRNKVIWKDAESLLVFRLTSKTVTEDLLLCMAKSVIIN